MIDQLLSHKMPSRRKEGGGALEEENTEQMVMFTTHSPLHTWAMLANFLGTWDCQKEEEEKASNHWQ